MRLTTKCDGTCDKCASSNKKPTSAIVKQNGKARTITAIASDGSVDCVGDRINPKGWQLERFRKNPVILWLHNAEKPVARASKVWTTADKLMVRIQFPKAGLNALADEVWSKVEAGLVTAVSVGFRTLSSTPNELGGSDIHTAELGEVSLVTLPCNENAVQVASMAAGNVKVMTASDLKDAIRPMLQRAVDEALPKVKMVRKDEAVALCWRSPRNADFLNRKSVV